jgi:hypothetical protein
MQLFIGFELINVESTLKRVFLATKAQRDKVLLSAFVTL